MPTYDYKCNECGHLYEYFQTMSDAPLKNCPECNGVVRRLVSGGSGLIFKGSGFYLTDYVKEDKSKKKSEEKPKKNVSKNQDKESAKS